MNPADGLLRDHPMPRRRRADERMPDQPARPDRRPPAGDPAGRQRPRPGDCSAGDKVLEHPRIAAAAQPRLWWRLQPRYRSRAHALRSDPEQRHPGSARPADALARGARAGSPHRPCCPRQQPGQRTRPGALWRAGPHTRGSCRHLRRVTGPGRRSRAGYGLGSRPVPAHTQNNPAAHRPVRRTLRRRQLRG